MHPIRYLCCPIRGSVDLIIYAVSGSERVPDRQPVLAGFPKGWRPSRNVDEVVADAACWGNYHVALVSRRRLRSLTEIPQTVALRLYPHLLVKGSIANSLLAARGLERFYQLPLFHQQLVKDGNRHWQSYAIASLILTESLGVEWWDVHVKSTKPVGQSFLLTAPSDDEQAERHRQRLIELAELIWNFRAEPGFRRILDRLKTDDRAIESTIGELRAAKMLVTSGCRLDFVDDRNGGDTFDFLVELPDTGLRICTEVKCKLEANDVTEASVTRVLKRASEQLPANRPSMIVVTLPDRIEADGISLEDGMAFATAAKRFLGSRPRIDRVIGLIQVLLMTNPRMLAAAAAIDYRNPLSLLDTPETITRESAGMNVVPNWLQLVDLV